MVASASGLPLRSALPVATALAGPLNDATAHPTAANGDRVTRSVTRYGIDGPGGLIGLLITTMLTLTAAGLALARGLGIGWGLLLVALAASITSGSYLSATLWGKAAVWRQEIATLNLAGAEQVLDLGCGRGLVLITVAQQLTSGRATGIDLWRAKDQSGNSAAATRRNAQVTGVADRVEVLTGDILRLPFDDASFDLVTSSLVVHNITTAQGRAQALCEALRVLRPGGLLMVADFRHVPDYAVLLRQAGAKDVQVRSLGRRLWLGPGWGASMVTARR
jgi:SAM-dependent methyltransferase